MLSKLQLKNARQHKNTLVEFIPGINTIVGPNNCGKSTIAEMIEFALYGSRALRDNAKGFVSDGETTGSATVLMDLAGDTYSVGRNTKNAEVRKNKELEAQYKENVSAYIAQITGVNQTGFRLGHYVRQKELAAFSSLRPGKRHETVERMLKVNAVDKAIAGLKEDISVLETRQKVMLSTYQDVEALNNELDDLRLVLESLSQRSDSLKKDLSDVSAVLAHQRDLQLKLAKKPELARIEQELSALLVVEVDRDMIERQLDELGYYTDEAYDQLQARVKELRGQERQSIEMQAKKRELDAVNPVQPEEVPEPEPPSEQYAFQTEANVNAKAAQIKKFSQLKDITQCEVCHQPLTQELFETLKAGMQEEFDELSKAAKAARSAFNELNAEFKPRLKAWQEYRLALRQYQADVNRRSRLLGEYVEIAFDPETLAELGETLEAVRKQRERWLKLDGERRSLEDKLSKRASLEERQQTLAHLADLKDDPELAGIIAQNEKTERELNEALRKTTSELAHAEGRRTELGRTVDSMQDTRAALESNSQEISKLTAMRDNFVLFKRHLTAKIRPLLQQVAEALFHRTTMNRYASLDLSSDYEITLTTHRGYTRKLSTISGSENDLACLCLRLAIATLRSTKLAGSLGFIILDEISGSFDDARTKQTLEGLCELREVIPQIINITHKPVEMRFADRLIKVSETNGVAQVTWED